MAQQPVLRIPDVCMLVVLHRCERCSSLGSTESPEQDTLLISCLSFQGSQHAFILTSSSSMRTHEWDPDLTRDEHVIELKHAWQKCSLLHSYDGTQALSNSLCMSVTSSKQTIARKGSIR